MKITKAKLAEMMAKECYRPELGSCLVDAAPCPFGVARCNDITAEDWIEYLETNKLEIVEKIMETYSVEITRTQWVTVDIKADSAEEAEEKARAMAEEDDSIFLEASEELEISAE